MNETKALDKGWLFKRLVKVFQAYGLALGGPDHINNIRKAINEVEDDISKQIVTATTTASEMILRSVFDEMDTRFHKLMMDLELKKDPNLQNKDEQVH